MSTEGVNYPYFCHKANEKVFHEMKIIVRYAEQGKPIIVGEEIKEITNETIDEEIPQLGNDSDEDFSTVHDVDGGSKVITHHTNFAQKVMEVTENATQNIQIEEMQKEQTSSNKYDWNFNKKVKEVQSLVEGDEEGKKILDKLMSKLKEDLVDKLQQKEQLKDKNKVSKNDVTKRGMEEEETPVWGYTVEEKKYKNKRHKKHWE